MPKELSAQDKINLFKPGFLEIGILISSEKTHIDCTITAMEAWEYQISATS